MRDYTLIRSDRKTLALQVKKDGQVVVRAPRRTSERKIEAFVAAHEEWIRKTQEKFAEARERSPVITEEARRAGIETARRILPQRTAYFAGRMGVTYGRITIREQRTRWGSCSAQGNLNFNWKLVLLPPEVLDYVVVHELAHRKEMNHSPRFWAVVEQELPDYRKRRQKLKEYSAG